MRSSFPCPPFHMAHWLHVDVCHPPLFFLKSFAWFLSFQRAPTGGECLGFLSRNFMQPLLKQNLMLTKRAKLGKEERKINQTFTKANPSSSTYNLCGSIQEMSYCKCHDPDVKKFTNTHLDFTVPIVTTSSIHMWECR